MFTLEARNVNDAYVEMLQAFRVRKPVPEPSRNGPVLRFPTPVVVTYERPNERVLFDAFRNANPFFHLMEGLWMLAGRNDVAFVAQFASNLANYSDDGRTIHGAYGYRWREHFGKDQIVEVVDQLLQNSNTRRCVIANFDPTTDGVDYVRGGGKDVPCNTHIYFAIRDQALDMTVMARSNDLVWGALGANAVHMSMLHEVVAWGARYELGKMYQFSNDYHIYDDKYKLEDLCRHASKAQPYRDITPVPLLTGSYVHFLTECEAFCEGRWDLLTEPFLKHTAVPMFMAWQIYKQGDIGTAMTLLNDVLAADWRWAAVEWMTRVKEKRDAKG